MRTHGGFVLALLGLLGGCTPDGAADPPDRSPEVADASSDAGPTPEVDAGPRADGPPQRDGLVPDASERIVFSPAAAEKEVDLQASIRVVFPRSIDEATIDRVNVRLSALENELYDTPSPLILRQPWWISQPMGSSELAYFNHLGGVATVLSYDPARRMLVVDPQGALRPHLIHRLTLAGLRYASGEPVPEQTLSFTTARNPRWKRHVFDRDSGQVKRWSIDEFDDPQHRRTKHLAFDGKGRDGQWYTADDHQLEGAYWLSFTHDPSGFRKIYHPAGSSETYRYDDYRRDAKGRLVTYLRYEGPGPDLSWFTADDAPARVVKYSYQAGQRTREVGYKYPGPDGSWLTADDLVFAYVDYAYDGQGMCTGGRGYDDPGADGQWFTQDDVQYFVVALTRDSAGRLRQQRYFRGSGLDGRWLTQDDDAGRYVRYEWDAGRLVRETTYGVGLDSLWFTDDDFIDAYSRYDYDAGGNQTKRVTYVGPGPDGDWYTDDDQLFLHYRVTFDRQNRRLEQTKYDDPGPDGLPFTIDDPVRALTEYHLTP